MVGDAAVDAVQSYVSLPPVEGARLLAGRLASSPTQFGQRTDERPGSLAPIQFGTVGASYDQPGRKAPVNPDEAVVIAFPLRVPHRRVEVSSLDVEGDDPPSPMPGDGGEPDPGSRDAVVARP